MTLHWPTSLAVNPVDQSVYILDGDVIIQLTSEHRLRVVVAASSTPCALTTAPRPVIITWQHGQPTDVALTPTGRLLMILDQHTLRAVDLLTGHVTQYVTADDCHAVTPSRCPVVARGNVSLTALSVGHDGVVYVTDVNNAIVYAVTSQLPRPHNSTGNYDVIDPSTQQRYTFNRSVNSECLSA